MSDNREIKARKIEAVLCDFLGTKALHGKRILDLGCGSGHIAEYFSRANTVIAADVVDQLMVAMSSTLLFQKIAPPPRPFASGSFDVVMSNHVLFCMRDPVRQLQEVRRVLRRQGVCYLATANRYYPREGFTKLPLLHYLPTRVFQAFYKLLGRPPADLFPVGYHRAIKIITQAGFDYREYTGEIIRHPVKYHSEYSVPLHLPVPPCLAPTLVFVLTKKGQDP